MKECLYKNLVLDLDAHDKSLGNTAETLASDSLCRVAQEAWFRFTFLPG